jgi:transitional endoplasmic reticulum ATPase
MKYLLEKTLQHLDSASEAWHRRQYRAARWEYLKSAECLFQAAAHSNGPLRQVRIEKAEQLLDVARRLEGPSRLDRKAHAEPVAVDAPDQSFLLREPAEVRFADVAGLEEAKEQIRLRLIYPLEYPEKAERYRIKRGGGLLLYGPPGTGKTLLARAVAGEIQAAFFTARPSELMSKWVGESEQNVARLFDEARQCPRAIVFVDEVEAMVPARRSSGSTVMQRVVPQFLAELQGVRSRQGTLLFMGATNEPWAIDPAALRPGRFDAKVYVGLPEQAARRQMLDLYLANRPLAADVDLERLAESLAGYSGADVAELCERCAARVFIESIRDGNEREITENDVRSALAGTQPSVSPKEVEKYRKWQTA